MQTNTHASKHTCISCFCLAPHLNQGSLLASAAPKAALRSSWESSLFLRKQGFEILLQCVLEIPLQCVLEILLQCVLEICVSSQKEMINSKSQNEMCAISVDFARALAFAFCLGTVDFALALAPCPCPCP